MLFVSSILMAFAWLGHIKFKKRPFIVALLLSWLLVIPEYLLNVAATRWGDSTPKPGEVDAGPFLPSEMGAINLCTGVICIALVSKYFLGEKLSARKITGFIVMAIGVLLVVL
jgi:hypothetical protein